MPLPKEQEQVAELLALASVIDVDQYEADLSVNGELIGGKAGIPGRTAAAIRELQLIMNAIDYKMRGGA